jgi:hypothetical protein
MQSKAETAWLTAAKCAKLAQEAEGTDEREFYTRMRDAWISVANRCEFLDLADGHAVGSAHQLPRSPL